MVLSLLRAVAIEWKYFPMLVGCPLLLAELILGILIIQKVSYTKIDWDAYMQEVEGPAERYAFVYSDLRGETGPLVYPAGFVWIYAGLRWIAGGDGSDIRTAQYVFLGMYVVTLATVLAVYYRAFARSSARSALPAYACGILILSKRVHSIYMLRMFNDAVAMMILYAAIAVFVCFKGRTRWAIGCVLYSLAVSVKMNIFLFAPALFVLMLKIVVGAPFIATDLFDYIRCAFGGFGDLQHKWTVNWKFLSPEIFFSRATAATLLLLHVVTLLLFAHFRWCRSEGGLIAVLRKTLVDGETAIVGDAKRASLSPEHIATVMLECNFIGIVFARSLHFQFYVWYWHALPLLLWSSARRLPLVAKFAILVLLEYAWSYGLEPVEGTSTAASSIALQVAHFSLLAGILLSETSERTAVSKKVH
eukprot:g3212.t1